MNETTMRRSIFQSPSIACDSRSYSLLFNLHLVGGHVAGLFLVILAITGSVLAFSGDIDSLLHPSLFRVVSQGQPLPLGQLASSAASLLHPGESIGTCVPSTRANASYSFIVFGGHFRIPRQIFVDQYTGRVLGSLSAVRFTQIMKALHSIAGLLGCSSVILVFLVLSGLYLWWPLKRIKIGLPGNVERLSFDLHNTVGLFESLFLFLFAITGTYMAFPSLPHAITHSKPVTQPAFSMPRVGVKPVSLDFVATAAKDTLPGATVLWIVIPRQPREAYFAKMRFPEDRSDNGSSAVWIDQFSGKLLQVASSRAAPLRSRIENLNRIVHTGAIFGVGGKALAAWLSLMLSLQSATGVLIWWSKRRGRTVSAPCRSKLSQSEPDAERPLHDKNSLQRARRINSITRLCSRGSWQNTDPLVMSNRVWTHTRRLGQGPGTKNFGTAILHHRQYQPSNAFQSQGVFSGRRFTQPFYRFYDVGRVIVSVSFRAVITVTAVLVKGELTS